MGSSSGAVGRHSYANMMVMMRTLGDRRIGRVIIRRVIREILVVKIARPFKIYRSPFRTAATTSRNCGTGRLKSPDMHNARMSVSLKA